MPRLTGATVAAASVYGNPVYSGDSATDDGARRSPGNNATAYRAAAAIWPLGGMARDESPVPCQLLPRAPLSEVRSIRSGSPVLPEPLELSEVYKYFKT